MVMTYSNNFFKKSALRSFLLGASLLLSGCGITSFFHNDKPLNYYIRVPTNEYPKAEEFLVKILEERWDNMSTLINEDAPEEDVHIEQAIQVDLLKALHAFGFYDATVDFINNPDEAYSGLYDIKYGPRYTIHSMKILPDAFTSAMPLSAHEINYLEAAPLLALQRDIQKEIINKDCFFTVAVTNDVYLNHQNASGGIQYKVNTSKRAYFSTVEFTGLERVKASLLERKIPWHPGDCFKASQIEAYKRTLLKTGLFSRIEAVMPPAPLKDNSVPIEFVLTERAPRTIKLGGSYYSDEGAGLAASWSHNNLFGSAERVDVGLTLSAKKQNLSLDFAKPYFRRLTQSLNTRFNISHVESDAYNEYETSAGIALKRQMNDRWRRSHGIDLSLRRINDKTDFSRPRKKDNFGLVSFPQSVDYDSRDNELDPHKGVLWDFKVEPYIDVLQKADNFLTLYSQASTYYDLGTPNNFVLAGRLSLGSILGTDTENIPAPLRFYGGGGGSIRGYGYQEVGPHENHKPSGGRSLATLSLELRGKATESIGYAVFTDIGSITDDNIPNFKDPAIGIGAGIRYFTNFGPLRFDVAIPTTERKYADQQFQIYISIGQAF
jgi:translocation and assembly module TamA